MESNVINIVQSVRCQNFTDGKSNGSVHTRTIYLGLPFFTCLHYRVIKPVVTFHERSLRTNGSNNIDPTFCVVVSERKILHIRLKTKIYFLLCILC